MGKHMGVSISISCLWSWWLQAGFKVEKFDLVVDPSMDVLSPEGQVT